MLRGTILSPLEIPPTATYHGQKIHFNLDVHAPNQGTGNNILCKVICPNDITLGDLKYHIAQHLHVEESSLSLYTDIITNPNDNRKLHELGLANRTLTATCNQNVGLEKVSKNPQFRRETIFGNNQEANAFKARPNIIIHPEREDLSKQLKGQEILKTENVTEPVPYQPVGQVKVYAPKEKGWAPLSVDLNMNVTNLYVTIFEHWGIDISTPITLYHNRKPLIRNGEVSLSKLGIRNGEKIHLTFDVKQEASPTGENLQATQQNPQSGPQMINVVCLINGEKNKKIVIQTEPNTTTMQELDTKIKDRLGCQDIITPFTYLLNDERINAMSINTLDKIFGSDINPAIIVRDVPLNVVLNYLANQQKQQTQNDISEQRQAEASKINNTHSLTANQINNAQNKQSIVPIGPYHISQTYSMVPQTLTPQQTIFAQNPMLKYQQPILSLDNIAQAIRKQKNPKTRLRMKRKLATLKRIRAYLAKKRAKSMFPSNNPHKPFMRQKAGYTSRKKKKHMATREKVISRMERNMRKRMKYKYKTRYKYKTKFKHKNLNDVRKYIIDENVAENNLTSGYGTGYNNSYYNY